jgi:phosphatidylglycerophosphate synthase
VSRVIQTAGSSTVGSPSVGDFYAVHRGGGLYSSAVSQRLGARFAALAYRLGLRPSAVTLVNLGLGLGASALLVVLAPAAARGDLPGWLLGLVALLGWQVAYSLDCADGQLARVTGAASPAGARLDILCDVAVQIALVAAIGSTAEAYRPSTPAWLVALFAGTWMVNLVTSVLATGANAASLVSSTSMPVQLVKLIRDYGAVTLFCGLVLTARPSGAVWLMAAFTVVNGGFLLVSVAASARAGLAPPAGPSSADAAPEP